MYASRFHWLSLGNTLSGNARVCCRDALTLPSAITLQEQSEASPYNPCSGIWKGDLIINPISPKSPKHTHTHPQHSRNAVQFFSPTVTISMVKAMMAETPTRREGCDMSWRLWPVVSSFPFVKLCKSVYGFYMILWDTQTLYGMNSN